MTEAVTLGGRRFVAAAGSTIEHDYWALARLKRAGLDGFEVAEGEAPERVASRLVGALLEAEVVFDLLGALLLPEGLSWEAWTPARAAETSDFLRGLSSPEDKSRVQVLVVTLLLGFFTKGLVSFRISRSSSAPGSPAAGPGQKRAESAAAATTGTGASSCGASLGTTPTARGASCAGPCERPCLH